MTISPGTRLGPYEIVNSVGAGGMGEVWRAKDTRLDRQVAIKVLPPGFAQNDEFLQRFEREARAISSLNHPHVCTLYDVGEAKDDSSRNSLHYLVMELIDGESLADRLKKGPLPPHDVLRYGRQIGSALDAAHRKGVIHRDLKPANIMLTKSGAKLLDFGLAKSSSGGGGSIEGLMDLATEARPLTREGTILGTFQYMAPEQLEGLEADPRTDIFAFGAVLYEMATGQRAFKGETKTSLIAAIVSSQPEPISQVSPMTPPALDHVVRRCLEKDPDDRWQSAQDIASQLQWISEAGSQAGVSLPQTKRRKSRERLAWGLLVLALTALTALGLAMLIRPGGLDGGAVREPLAVTFTVPAPAGGTIRSTGEDAAAAAVSRDGRRVVFGVLEPSGQNRLWLRELDSAEARPLPGTQNGSRPFWSPDGQSIGFFSNGKLKRLDLAGGVVLPLADAPSGRGGTWTPDGTIVYAPESGSALFAIPAAGGNASPLTEIDRAAGEDSHRYPSVLPDGQSVVFLVLEAGGRTTTGAEADQSLHAIRLGTRERKLLLRGAANAEGAGDDLLFYQGGALRAQRIDLDRLELTGAARTVVADVKYDAAYERASFSVSRETLVYEPGPYKGETVLTWVGPDGAVLGTIGEPSLQTAPTISPDGRRVAYARVGSESPGVWITDLDTGRSQRVSPAQGVYAQPIWSPDGAQLAYSALVEQRMRPFIASLTEGRSRALLDEGDSDWAVVDWSGDGRTLLVSKSYGEELGSYDLQEGNLASITFSEGGTLSYMAELSPDSRWLAFTSDRSGIAEIEVISYPGMKGRWAVSTGGGAEPKWAAGGGALYYRTPGGGIARTTVHGAVEGFRVGETRILFQAPPIVDSSDPSFDVAPGEERFLINAADEKESRIPLTISVGWRERR
jgi:eukaryotic-like serine/threonine-protein kinase